MTGGAISPRILRKTGIPSHPGDGRSYSAFPALKDRVSDRSAVRAAAYALPVLLATVAGFGLRTLLLHRFPLREDEAIYAYWALHAWREDPMFLRVWPDKPPLYLWLLGGTLQLFGASEASTRWLNIACSTLAIPVVAATARRAWSHRAGVIAAVALALNPYAVSFGATAFTDPLLVLAGTLALCLAMYGRGAAAGLALGAAVMTKQQGLLFVPLVMAGLWVAAPPDTWTWSAVGRSLLRIAAGAALVIVPILYWDSLRWSVAPSPWDLSTRTYAALALLPPTEWPGRATVWGELIRHLAGSWPAWALAAGIWLGGILASRRSKRSEDNRLIVLIAGWSAGFLLLHAATTVQVWDRYLLPLAPMLALSLGWGGSRLAAAPVWRPQAMPVVLAAALLVWTPPALRAAAGGIPIGGDHGAYAGLTAALEQVRSLGGERYVLYHQTLGWHYRFYLYDDVDAGRVDLRWFPSTVYLADNAAKTPYPLTYLIEPEWAGLPDLAAHLAMRGLALTPRGEFGRFRVWQVTHLPQGPCDWCVSRSLTAWPHLPAKPGPSTPVQP